MIVIRHVNLLPSEDPTFYVDDLMKQLKDHPLDRRYEAHGGFEVGHAPDLREGFVRFLGNFAPPYSALHFFIETDEADEIHDIRAAISENRRREDYLSQPPPFCASLITVNEHRLSTTQAEVSLAYDGVELGRFGETVSLDARGQFGGHPRAYWEWVARKLFDDRLGGDDV